ncbi:MAG: peptide chain release factor N(5)-glutamine methyltransferase [Prevotellaceae bacterium]|jgi:release factor glutamine methyltransferase|nr:peptide chain release factor N(5)-glutamine methyltransferase [Prevotellaceae bacterium]
MPRISDLVIRSAQKLQPLYPAKEARVLAYQLLQHYSGLSRAQLYACSGQELSHNLVEKIEAGIDGLLASKPLQYIIGEAEFCGLPFMVNESVLIPRPETEELVQLAVQTLRTLQHKSEPVKALDLCTGSGCIAVSVAAQLPAVPVAACDVSREALEVAQINAQRHHTQIDFFSYDILQQQEVLAAHLAPASVQAILSNPPYVRRSEQALMQPNVLRYEPHLALFVDDDDPLVFYRAIASVARQYLAPAGFVLVEINEALAEATAEVFRAAGFFNIQIKKDLNDKNRFVMASCAF